MDFGGEHRSTSIGGAADGSLRFSDARRTSAWSAGGDELGATQPGQVEVGSGTPADSRETTESPENVPPQSYN